MKKTVIFIVMLCVSMAGKAQITVAEPEFAGTYCLLTSDSSYVVLPKENGTIKEHQNKVSKWSKITSKISNVAEAAGIVGLGTAGSVSAVSTSARVITTASGVGAAASSVNALAGAEGKDIVFDGNASSITTSLDNGDIHIVVKEEDNETNPVDLYRVVRLASSKKDRRVQWISYSSALLGTSEAEKSGYVTFSGTKYGEQSYLLTIPSSSLSKGQYAVFYLNIELAVAIPVATFGIE